MQDDQNKEFVNEAWHVQTDAEELSAFPLTFSVTYDQIVSFSETKQCGGMKMG